MPGVPPISTAEPTINPPPRILSNSFIPVSMQGHSSDFTCVIGCGNSRLDVTDLYLEPGGVSNSSIVESHSPQPPQRPTHFRLFQPQCRQTYTTPVFVICMNGKTIKKGKILLSPFIYRNLFHLIYRLLSAFASAGSGVSTISSKASLPSCTFAFTCFFPSNLPWRISSERGSSK